MKRFIKILVILLGLFLSLILGQQDIKAQQIKSNSYTISIQDKSEFLLQNNVFGFEISTQINKNRNQLII